MGLFIPVWGYLVQTHLLCLFIFSEFGIPVYPRVSGPVFIDRRIARQATMTPPRFTLPLTDTTVKEGELAVLECNLVGSPIPSVQWFCNNLEVKVRTGYSKRSSATMISDTARTVCH